MLEVEFVPFEFGYFLVCKSFAKSSLIRWSSSGLVKTSMAVIARAFPWDKVKGWAAGSPVKRWYDWLKRTTKWLDLKESLIMRFIRSRNSYKSIKDVGFFLVLLVHEIISLITVAGFAKKKMNTILKKKKTIQWKVNKRNLMPVHPIVWATNLQLPYWRDYCKLFTAMESELSEPYNKTMEFSGIV